MKNSKITKNKHPTYSNIIEKNKEINIETK